MWGDFCILEQSVFAFAHCAYSQFFFLFFSSKTYKQRLSFHILPAIRSKCTFIQMVFIDLVAALVIIMHICTSKEDKKKLKKLIAIYLSFRYSSHFIFWTISTNYRLYLNRFSFLFGQTCCAWNIYCDLINYITFHFNILLFQRFIYILWKWLVICMHYALHSL